MKYLLLLILPLLSNAVIPGFSASPRPNAGYSYCSSGIEDRIAKGVSNHESHINTADDLKETLEEAFIVSPRDTFPIQVGAFKNKSNADKISKGIKNIPDVEVRIIVEEGLYKVRISRLPESVKFDKNYLAALSDREKVIPKDNLKSDPVVDSSDYNVGVPAAFAISDTSETAADTANTGSVLIFFKEDSPMAATDKVFRRVICSGQCSDYNHSDIYLHYDHTSDHYTHEQEKDGEGRKASPVFNGEISEPHSRFPLWISLSEGL